MQRLRLLVVVGGFLLLGLPAYAAFSLFSTSHAAVSTRHNSQTLPLPRTLASVDPVALGGGDITIVGGTALLPDAGPLGTLADVANEFGSSDQISIYTVRSGDKLADIAEAFDVSVNTVIWANNLSRGAPLKEGQVLVILPISGVKHIVRKGDTLQSIAAKYKADADEIALYNSELLADGLTLGIELIVPDGEVVAPVVKKAAPKKTAVKNNPAHDYNGPSYAGYYSHPLPGARRTQGLHGYNGIDLAGALGAPIRAAAAGVVIVSRQGGWGGGYGNYVVISHANGTQTLYAHLQKNLVREGASVGQGQTIGLMGNTGRSTGPHLHFEVRGAKNPF